MFKKYAWGDPIHNKYALSSDINVLVAWAFITSEDAKKFYNEDEIKRFKSRVIYEGSRYGLGSKLIYNPEEVDANIIKEMVDRKEKYDKVLASINIASDLVWNTIRDAKIENKKEVVVAVIEELRNAIIDMDSF